MGCGFLFSTNSVRSCSRSVLVFGLFGLKSLRSLRSLRLKFGRGNGDSLLFDSRTAPAQNRPTPRHVRPKAFYVDADKVYGKMGNQVSTLRALVSAFSIWDGTR